jgi:hypothetical protein
LHSIAQQKLLIIVYPKSFSKAEDAHGKPTTTWKAKNHGERFLEQGINMG